MIKAGLARNKRFSGLIRFFESLPASRTQAPALLALGATLACTALDADPSPLGHCPDPSGPSPQEFHLAPEWRAGGSADTTLLLSPPLIFPTVAPGGGLSLAQRFQAPILTLNADGSLRSRIGRAGTGPGEWGAATTVGIAGFGDTLQVVQMSPPRVHLFDESGNVLASRRIRHGSEASVWPLRVMRNGDFVGALPPAAEGATRRLARWTDGSRDADSLDVFHANVSYRVDWPGGAFAVVMHPVPDHVLEAAAPDGRSVVVVNRRAAARADSAHFRIRSIADDGTRLFDVAQCYLPVPFPDREAFDTVRAQAAMLRPAAPALPASPRTCSFSQSTETGSGRRPRTAWTSR